MADIRVVLAERGAAAAEVSHTYTVLRDGREIGSIEKMATPFRAPNYPPLWWRRYAPDGSWVLYLRRKDAVDDIVQTFGAGI